MSVPRFILTLGVVGTDSKVSTKLRTRVSTDTEHMAQELIKEITHEFGNTNTVERLLSLINFEETIEE